MTERASGRLRALAARQDPRAVFWTSWASLAAMTFLWVLANPLGAAPDEPTHYVKAAGLVREQTLGVETRPGVGSIELPHLYSLPDEMSSCFKFDPNIPASCWPRDFGDVAAPQVAETTARGYNPLYYAVVGLPSLLEPRLGVLYLMRLVSALLCTLPLAMGLRSLAEMPVRRWAVTGAAVAVTPMVVFLASAVNPGSLEIAAGLGLWATLLAALHHPAPELTGRRWLRAGVLVALLVNSKALAPLFLAIIVLTCVALLPWSRTWAAIKDRRSWPGLAVGAAGTLLALVWTATAGGVTGSGEVAFPDRDLATAFEDVTRSTTYYVQNMIGYFGWLDSRPPHTVYTWVTAVVGILFVLALAGGNRRQRLVLGALGLSVVALPIILQVPQAQYLGYAWQGRYLLPVAVGVPLAAGVIADRVLAGVPRRISVATSFLVVGAMLTVHVVSFASNLRRYVAGADARWFEPVETPWAPPLPSLVLVVGFTAAATLFAVLLLRLMAPDGGADAVGGDDRAPGAAVSPGADVTADGAARG